jgi:glycosyltransferase involved in cell wall biosynthesis
MMFDPGNVSEIAEKSGRILLDKQARQDNLNKGRARVLRFDWRESAEKLMDIYNSL